jgi:[FeFe] hydrogenase H-cluster maturation GTPase HydF
MQISFFGATNSGKSTLVNAIAGQQVSLVSELPGTTTDPVRKRIELPGIGPCTLVDTAGYGDEGALGAERERLTRAVIDSTDVAVLLRSGHPSDPLWESLLHKAAIPVVAVEGHPVISSEGEVEGHPVISSEGEAEVERSQPDFSSTVEMTIRRIAEALPREEERFLTGSLVKPGDTVLLVMPQDSEAPKGRIILPQVQVIRELLDRGCVPVCCTPASLPGALQNITPNLVITDSQVFKLVNETIPSGTPLTSFSILLAAAKGDISTFIEGAKAIDTLRPGNRVLIAEACTHVPDTEDIGRVKIPALLRRRADVGVDIAAGNDFPEDLSPYSLIVHCGACVATSALVRSRTRKALLAGVPITNYGIALAKLQGILDRVVLP